MADCTAGKKALGGGYLITATSITVTANYPTDTDTWTITADESGTFNGDWSVQAYVVCATMAP